MKRNKHNQKTHLTAYPKLRRYAESFFFLHLGPDWGDLKGSIYLLVPSLVGIPTRTSFLTTSSWRGSVDEGNFISVSGVYAKPFERWIGGVLVLVAGELYSALTSLVTVWHGLVVVSGEITLPQGVQ